jgi:hypothetical protein
MLAKYLIYEVRQFLTAFSIPACFPSPNKFLKVSGRLPAPTSREGSLNRRMSQGLSSMSMRSLTADESAGCSQDSAFL